MGQWSVGIGGGVLKINPSLNTEEGQDPSYQTTASRGIKILCTETKLIGLPIQNPTGVQYPNGDFASVLTTSFQTMMTDTVTKTSDLRGALCGEATEKAHSLVG